MAMAASGRDSAHLENRRRQLGMSCAVLAKRAGVSLATVQRMLGGNLDSATMANVRAVAAALGLDLEMHASTSAQEFCERQAEAKAKQLVDLVQGSSGLEGQGVDAETLSQMVQQTIHELMAGSKRKLWAV